MIERQYSLKINTNNFIVDYDRYIGACRKNLIHGND